MYFYYYNRAADCPADKVDQSLRARLLLDIQYDEKTKPPKRKRDKNTSSSDPSDPTSSNTSNKAVKRYKKNTKSTTNTTTTSSSSSAPTSASPTAMSASSLQPSLQPPYPPIKLHECVDSLLEPFTYLNQYPGALAI